MKTDYIRGFRGQCISVYNPNNVRFEMSCSVGSSSAMYDKTFFEFKLNISSNYVLLTRSSLHFPTWLIASNSPITSLQIPGGNVGDFSLYVFCKF